MWDRMKSRRLRHAWPFVPALSVLLLASAMGLWAQAQPRLSPGTVNAGTPDEIEALELYRQDKPIKARTLAEKVLERNPYSMVGHFVTGAVLHEAEGSLARAMYHLGRARELYETTWAASTRPADAPWELHRETLYHLQILAGEMELHAYQLEVIGYYDYLYDPDLVGEHAWPMMELGRFADARRYAEDAASRNDSWQKSLGLNALCAIEGEAGRRQEYYDACIAALHNAKNRGGSNDENEQGAVAVHAYNAALAARGVLRFDEVEQLALDGARRLEFTPANPWRILVRHYLDAGRLTDAVHALREMQRWRGRQPGNLRDQDRAETDVTFATVLLLAGETDVGLRAVTRAIDQPDRRGLTSDKPEQALGAHALLRRALSRAHAERLAEEAAAMGFVARVAEQGAIVERLVAAWPDEERIISVLASGDRLSRTLRFYVHGGLAPLSSWLVGDLIEVLGPGVVSVALGEARRYDRELPGLTPYYDGLEAEVALARGDEAVALAKAQVALEGLPAHEAMLRARILAVAGAAALSLDQDRSAMGFLEQAMQIDGGVLRRLDIALPARVSGRGSGAVAKAVAALERSPRLTDGSLFEVRVEGRQGGGLSACLRTATGNQIRCAEVFPEPPPDPVEAPDGPTAANPESANGDEPAKPEPIEVLLARRFHRVVFGAAVTLSSADLTSLDGRTTTGADVARQQLEGLLDGVIERGDPSSAPGGASAPPP